MIILIANAVSVLMRHNTSSNVMDWLGGQAAPEIYLTIFNRAELPECVEIPCTGGRRDRLLEAAEGMLREDSDGLILPFGSAAAHTYTVITATRRAAGPTIDYAGCQIKAIARNR